ncbi:alcohol dehydrogenase [Mycolicibacterium tusciae]|uniref:alcohol dehydrogenase n=1 Tax=Mycolicibacterium tusciae TaxID=75922 RepID=UPI00024A16FC|nr:alcohol dehydrogenase [Mycolicibacterium tusciae]
MKAAVYYGPEDIRCTRIEDPVLRAEHEILVEVRATSICGSDLHLYRGALDAAMKRGESQTGHELTGEVVEVGKAVGRFRPGDRVSMAFSVSCDECYMCRVGQTAHCETTQKAVYGFGVPFGDLNGTHAEALVIPHADAHALKIPNTISDVAALTLSCNLPSALIANHIAQIQPGENVAVIGCGPTGLMTLDLVLHRGPGRVVVLDKVPHRLEAAHQKGAEPIDVREEGWKDKALAEVSGRGFDKVIEIVGYPETLKICLDLVRAGGTVAAIGVFTDPTFDLNLSDMFLRDITLHMNGFANVQPYMWEALRLIERGVVNPEEYFSHTFALSDIDQAFSTFYNKADRAMKMHIRP